MVNLIRDLFKVIIFTKKIIVSHKNLVDVYVQNETHLSQFIFSAFYTMPLFFKE